MVLFELEPELRVHLRKALREPMIAPPGRGAETVLDRPGIESLLPHRDPFLFLDRVTFVERTIPLIVCRYDPAGSAPILDGHFPGRPVWPGVLQVEAIGQAGLCLARLLNDREDVGQERPFALTHIVGAEFSRPIIAGAELEIICRLLPDGLFHILVGQCLQQGRICCAAAVRGTTLD
jgi:3-hydroxyacyl-[acyl-carrier-protein] dehydratase